MNINACRLSEDLPGNPSHERTVGCASAPEGLSPEVQALVAKQELGLTKLHAICSETMMQLTMYEGHLDVRLNYHKALLNKLQCLVDENSAVMKDIHSEKNKLQEMKADVETRRCVHLALLKQLAQVINNEEATTVCNEVDLNSITTEVLMSRCQRCFPDTNLAASSHKVM